LFKEIEKFSFILIINNYLLYTGI